MVTALTARQTNAREGIVKNVTLTNAQVLTLNTVPTVIMTAPLVSTNAIFITSIYATIAAGTAYASTNDILLKYTNASGAITGTITASGFLTSTAALGIRGSVASGLITPGAVIVATCGTGDPTTGTSPIKITIRYRIVRVQAF